MTSDYVLQKAEGTTCEHCHSTVHLLCPRMGVTRPRHTSRPSFYICPTCHSVGEIGVGPVPWGEVDTL